MATAKPFMMMCLLPSASAFVVTSTPPSLLAETISSATIKQRHYCPPHRAPKPTQARVSPVMSSLVPSTDSADSRRPSAFCHSFSSSERRPPSFVLRSTAEVDVITESDGGGGEGGDTSPAAVVVDEFDVKTNLLKKIDLSSARRMRTEVNELMLKLEPMNPTDTPARSAILNGVWEFLYTGGVSPGTLAVQVLSRIAKNFSSVLDLKGVTLTISRDQPRVEAAVKISVLGTEAQVKVRTRLEEKSDMRLQEVYEEAEMAGVTIPIPTRIQPRRTLYITYLDEDIMIARDDSGAPDLLIRKQKEFRFNTGTPSTSEDDDSSPGSG